MIMIISYVESDNLKKMKRFEFIVPCFVLFFGVLVDMFGRGYVTTDALLLQGNSSATLNNASNNVTSIASNTSPTFGLILYSDLISISTLIGDLTMMGDIGMASPSANIRLNPGRDKPAVTITDGNRKLDPAATLAIMFNAYEKLLMHTGYRKNHGYHKNHINHGSDKDFAWMEIYQF